MRFPGEPTEEQTRVAQHRFEEWCRENQLDPEDTPSSVLYEEWWELRYPPGEEEREWRDW